MGLQGVDDNQPQTDETEGQGEGAEQPDAASGGFGVPLPERIQGMASSAKQAGKTAANLTSNIGKGATKAAGYVFGPGGKIKIAAFGVVIVINIGVYLVATILLVIGLTSMSEGNSGKKGTSPEQTPDLTQAEIKNDLKLVACLTTAPPVAPTPNISDEAKPDDAVKDTGALLSPECIKVNLEQVEKIRAALTALKQRIESNSSSANGNTTISGGLQNPLGTAAFRFGTHDEQYAPESTSHIHEGIDLVATGQGDHAVVASAAGTVVATQNNCSTGKRQCAKGFGNFVYLQHADAEGKPYYTVYAHMKQGSVAVSVGKSVSVGQKLGVQGNTGRSDEDHVHFAVFVHKGAYNLEEAEAAAYSVNPCPYLGISGCTTSPSHGSKVTREPQLGQTQKSNDAAAASTTKDQALKAIAELEKEIDGIAEANGKYTATKQHIDAYNALLAKGDGLLSLLSKLFALTGACSQYFGKTVPVQVNNSLGYANPVAGSSKSLTRQGDDGLDMVTAFGTPVVAITDGTVRYQNNMDGSHIYGNWSTARGGLAKGQPDNTLGAVGLTLKDGQTAFYAHLSAIDPGLKAGGSVKRGQVIGCSGRANNNAHLHIGISPYVEGRAYDLEKLWY